MKSNIWRNPVLVSLILILAGGCVAAGPPPLPPTMYIDPAVTYLREGPSLNSPTLVELQSGDKLDILEASESGWCKVRSARTDLVGYVPRDLCVAAPPPPKPVAAPEKPRLPAMYVAVKTVKLREEPNNRADVVKEVEFSQKVEKLDENKNWIQVQDPVDHKTGWVPYWTVEGFKLSKPKVLRAYRHSSGGGGGGAKKEAQSQAPDAM